MIRKYVALLAPSHLRLGVNVFVTVSLTQHDEPSLRRLLGERARCTVAALTPASYADRLKAIYAEALAERNAERLLCASR